MKYIDADKLRAEVERLYKQNEGDFDNGCYNEDQRCGYDIALLDLRMILDSLQQEQQEEVLIPKWCLENIENTLRIQHNINNDVKDGETCQDRNIKESLNCVRKLLNGEEITGRERLEPLMKQSEVDLEKEIEKYYYDNFAFISSAHTPTKDIVSDIAYHFYERGAELMAEQGAQLIGRIKVNGMGQPYLPPEYIYLSGLELKEGDKVIVQIRKKEIVL